MAVDGCQKMFKYHLPSSQTSVKIQKDERWLAAWHTSIFNYLLWNYCNSPYLRNGVHCPSWSVTLRETYQPRREFFLLSCTRQQIPLLVVFLNVQRVTWGPASVTEEESSFCPKGEESCSLCTQKWFTDKLRIMWFSILSGFCYFFFFQQNGWHSHAKQRKSDREIVNPNSS